MVSIRGLVLGRSSTPHQSGVEANTSTTLTANSKSKILLQQNEYGGIMGPSLSKSTEVVKAEKFEQQSLDDSSWSIINLHGTSTAGGAIVVLLILGLVLGGYAVKWYKDKRAQLRLRTATAKAITA